MLPQNAFAMGPAPGTCNNEYDGSYVSATIIAGNQTYYPLQNNLTFKMIIGQSYNLTTIIHVPNQSSQSNSLPGSLWYSSNDIGYDQNYCSPTVNPGTNYTISTNEGFPRDYNPGQSQAISVYWAPNGYSYTVDWAVPSASPSSPTNLSATVSNPSQINLSWTAPSNNGGSAITNYKIYRSTSSGTETLLTEIGNATSFNDSNVTSGQNYFYKVTAVNSVGESSQSNEASATLKVDQVITTVYVAGGEDPYGIAINTNTNMIYSRDAGCCGGGSPLAEINGSTNSLQSTIGTTRYGGYVAVNPNTNTIYYSNSYESNSVSVINGSTNSLITNIQLGSGSSPGAIAVNPNTNKIYVTAHDGVYEIDGSTNTVVSKIGAGDGRAITVNPNTNMIYVSNFGSNSTSVIDGSTNTVVKTIPVGYGPNDFAVNPITNKIFVANFWGGTVSVIDGATNTVTSTLNLGPHVIGVDVNPTTDKLYLSLGNSSVSVINDKTYGTLQNIPLNNGLGLIGVNTATDRVYVAEDGGGVEHIPGNVVVIQGSSSYTITAPSSPQNLQSVAGNAQVSITWTAPSSTGGSEIYYYNVYRGLTPNGEGSAPIASALPPNVSYTNTGLTNGQTYYYKVTAVNHVGESTPSNEASATPAAPVTVPSAPQNLQATASSASQINLSWTAPSNNGGVAITGYMIERSKDNGTTWSTIQSNTTSTSTTYSDTGLSHSTTYTYRVSAINSAGTSIPSNIASATTLNTVPTSPTGLTATPNLTQINLAWNAPSDNGGTPVTGYKIERSTNSGTTWTTLVANTASSSTTYSDSNVLPLTTYTYRVSAINSIGTSSPSNTASASTTSGGSSSPPPSGITLNNVQSTSGTTTSSNQMTLSSFNVGSGNNQILVVGISANNQDATSVTFNSQPLTKAVSSFNNNAAQFWYLKNPSGTGNIVATFGGQTQSVVGAYSFANVNQTNPIPTTATNTNSASSSPTISITTKYANDWVLDLPSIYGGQKLGSPTCTQEWNANIPSAITGGSSSTTVSSPGSVTCKWTASNGGDLWDDVAVEVKSTG